MSIPLQITFRNMSPSEAIERSIREHATEFERFSGRILGCRVVVEARHHRHHQGNLYHVRIDLTVPGEEIVVSREPAMHHAHEDPYVTVRDAFDAARRRVEDFERRNRQQVKTHEAPHVGRIAFIDREKGFGFIETVEGREIYFHRHSVLSADFERLEIGDRVRFHEEAGDKGPQASTVRVEEKCLAVGREERRR